MSAFEQGVEYATNIIEWIATLVMGIIGFLLPFIVALGIVGAGTLLVVLIWAWGFKENGDVHR